jgi:hypothetical protein
MAVVQVLMTRPREEWKQDVAARYRTLEQFSKEDARMQFLRILRSLPYGEWARSLSMARSQLLFPVSLFLVNFQSAQATLAKLVERNRSRLLDSAARQWLLSMCHK